ncbi:hypothetical protein AMAG_08200 [Allomyces macrogynus ATCC 38327]|uniref:Uncharacterized protein n=1 Tax=Allomyces macrogynus (strain ATCC 38327) TaxID=578462 RepID=A0A0L0SKR9_ALLM3|nr:hypothetical protein AMAG_08200 [Allomyces macrogynus ATCC 38327]|eukprot:KNE63033.1 hypothetical protein AMAG_08200 [Allomyces macrogynus ATCC 38327]
MDQLCPLSDHSDWHDPVCGCSPAPPAPPPPVSAAQADPFAPANTLSGPGACSLFNNAIGIAANAPALVPAPLYRTVQQATLHVVDTLAHTANSNHFRLSDENAGQWTLYVKECLAKDKNANWPLSIPNEVRSDKKYSIEVRLVIDLAFGSLVAPNDARYEYTAQVARAGADALSVPCTVVPRPQLDSGRVELQCKFLFQCAKHKGGDVLTVSMSVRSLAPGGGGELADVQVDGFPTSIECMSDKKRRRLQQQEQSSTSDQDASDAFPPLKRQRLAIPVAPATVSDSVSATVPNPATTAVLDTASSTVTGASLATISDAAPATISDPASSTILDTMVDSHGADHRVEVAREYLREGAGKAIEIIGLLEQSLPLARTIRLRFLASLLRNSDRIASWPAARFNRILGLLCAGDGESVWSAESPSLMHLVAKNCHDAAILELVFRPLFSGSTAQRDERNALLEALRVQNSAGFTPVHAAARKCNVAFLAIVARGDVNALLERSERDDGTFLHSLVNCDNSHVVLSALEYVVLKSTWATLLAAKNERERTPRDLVEFQVTVRGRDKLRATVEWVRTMEARVVGTSLGGEGDGNVGK